jgi:hypothetical protein
MQLCHEQQANSTQSVSTVENWQQINFQVKVEPATGNESMLLVQIQQVLQNLCTASFSN